MFAVCKLTKALTSRTGREVPSTVALAFLAQLKVLTLSSLAERNPSATQAAQSEYVVIKHFVFSTQDEERGSICEKDDRRVEIAPSCRDTIHY
jgi:hypothetical protein